VTTYSPGSAIPLDVIKHNWPLLGTSNLTKDLYDNKVVRGYRRCKNVKDYVVRARVPDLDETPKKHPTCNTKRCRYCPKLNKKGRIKSTTSGREYASKINVSCKSNNLIYCITCKKCKKQYVGQTKNRLIDRFGKHFYHITSKNKTTPIGRHFCQKDHEGLSDIEIHIVDFIHCDPESNAAASLRDKIEKNWIQRLKCSAPFGINTMDVKY